MPCPWLPSPKGRGAGVAELLLSHSCQMLSSATGLVQGTHTLLHRLMAPRDPSTASPPVEAPPSVKASACDFTCIAAMSGASAAPSFGTRTVAESDTGSGRLSASPSLGAPDEDLDGAGLLTSSAKTASAKERQAVQRQRSLQRMALLESTSPCSSAKV